jgi:hypothetical protein
MTRLGLLLSSVTAPLPAFAASCFAAVAGAAPMVMPASLRLAAAGEVALAFLGDASFLIESPGGVRIVTDDNGVDRPGLIPDIVTMNHAHPSHCTERRCPASSSCCGAGTAATASLITTSDTAMSASATCRPTSATALAPS